MELEEINIGQICRTCKSVTPHMRFLFEGYESPRFDEMLMACASVQVICGDGLPSQICQMCVEQLKTAFVFKCQCEKIDASLREYAKNVKVIEIKEEPQNFEFVESLNTLNNPLNEKSPLRDNMRDGTPNLVTPKIETDCIQEMDNNQILLTCHECNKIFTTPKGLRCHNKRIHTGTQRYEQSHGRKKVHICKICSKVMTRVDHLKRHLMTHLREKPFSCKTCNRGFNRVEYLHKHIPRCKGETVYPCDICNKSFNREDSLEVHKKIQHNQQSKLPTIENVDNIEEHYYQVDQEADAVSSDHSDVDDCFKPQVDVTENINEGIIKAVFTNPDEEGIVSEVVFIDAGDNDFNENKGSDNSEEKAVSERMETEEIEDRDVKEEKVIDAFEEEEDFLRDNNDVLLSDKESSDNTNSECPPNKSVSPKIKCGQSRPCENPNSLMKPPRLKVPGRGRRRPPHKLTIKVKKEEKDEKYGEFPCPACHESFTTMSQLHRHARQKHKGLKVHKCKVCNKEFNGANFLRRHETSHSTIKPFHCTVCTKSFNRRDHLNQHQKLHERQNYYKCDICPKAFSRTDYLTKHKASIHGIGRKVDIIREKKYERPLCYKGFITEKHRDVPMNGYEGEKKYQCKVCEKSFLSECHLTEHMKSHDEHSKKFLCSECGQRFNRKDYLVIHMRRHRGEKPFKCKYCEKSFPRTTDLNVHERYHTGEKTHLCTICGRGFGRGYNLTVHMRRHTGEKPYQCTYCHAAFAQGNELKVHVRRHTVKKFQCELCTERFFMRYLLTQHKRTVHGRLI